MKRSELYFNIASIPVDFLSLILAGLGSFYVRLKIQSFLPIIFIPDLHEYLVLLLKLIPLMILVFVAAGLYNLKGTRNFQREFSKIAQSISIAFFVIILVFFFNQSIFPSRLIILTSWLLSIVFVVAGRYVVRKIQVYQLNRGRGLHKLVVLTNTSRSPLVENLRKNKRHGYTIIAEIHDNEKIIERLEELYDREGIEEILQANTAASDAHNFQIVQFARAKGLVFNFVPNLFNVQKNMIETETLDDVPMISLKNTPLDGWAKVIKRVFDIIVSLFCLVVTSPLFLLIAIAIKLDSRGKVLYAAERGGLKSDFLFYKFRTMYQHLSIGEGYGGEEAEKVRQELWKMNVRGGPEAAFLKIKDDPRVTRVGRFLRKSKLDEIPQFLNVLFGDMSMVGPRAHVVEEVDRYRDHYRRLFTIKPGIFGLSQIAQMSWPDLPFEEEVRLNTYYIENWSLWLDIVILAKSFWYLFFKPKPKGDY